MFFSTFLLSRPFERSLIYFVFCSLPSFVDTSNGLYVKQLSFTPSSTRLFRVKIDFNRGCCFLVQAMLPEGFPFHQFNSSNSSLVFFLLFELSVKQFYSTFWFQDILMKPFLAKNRCPLITFWYICYFALNLSFTTWSIILTYFCIYSKCNILFCLFVLFQFLFFSFNECLRFSSSKCYLNLKRCLISGVIRLALF